MLNKSYIIYIIHWLTIFYTKLSKSESSGDFYCPEDRKFTQKEYENFDPKCRNIVIISTSINLLFLKSDYIDETIYVGNITTFVLVVDCWLNWSCPLDTNFAPNIVLTQDKGIYSESQNPNKVQFKEAAH